MGVLLRNTERIKVTHKWLKNDSKVGSGVTFESLWGRSAGVTFESLLGHFNSVCVSGELGALPLQNKVVFE